MKQRILSAALAVLCALTLVASGVAPAYANVPPSEGSVEIQAEQVRWYYRTNHGVREMRIWSVTYQYWKTDWFPVPEGWNDPGA